MEEAKSICIHVQFDDDIQIPAVNQKQVVFTVRTFKGSRARRSKMEDATVAYYCVAPLRSTCFQTNNRKINIKWLSSACPA